MVPEARPRQCSSCVFRGDGRGIQLAPGRLEEIAAYSVQGTNHLCHTPGPSGRRDELVCRGARDLLLRALCAAGILAEPTDEALVAAEAEWQAGQAGGPPVTRRERPPR